MSAEGPPARGVLASLRRLCDAGLGLLQSRIELFALEVHEEKARLVRVLVLAGMAVFLGNMAAVAVTVTIVVLAGESGRVPALVGFSLLYVTAAVVVALALRKELRSAPPPFSNTVAELKKDREWLKSPQ